MNSSINVTCCHRSSSYWLCVFVVKSIEYIRQTTQYCVIVYVIVGLLWRLLFNQFNLHAINTNLVVFIGSIELQNIQKKIKFYNSLNIFRRKLIFSERLNVNWILSCPHGIVSGRSWRKSYTTQIFKKKNEGLNNMYTATSWLFLANSQ